MYFDSMMLSSNGRDNYDDRCPSHPEQPECRRQGRATILEYLSPRDESELRVPAGELAVVAHCLSRARHEGRTVFVLGNGACAALASHMAADLGKALMGCCPQPHTPLLRITALTDNSAYVTALGNDLDFRDVFVEQLRNFVTAGDVVIGLSASGTSPNVLRAMRFARKSGAQTICFTGELEASPPIVEDVDVAVIAPSSAMDRVEDLHVAYHHAVVRAFRAMAHGCEG